MMEAMIPPQIGMRLRTKNIKKKKKKGEKKKEIKKKKKRGKN
jgi:hypothetical protein